MKKNKWVFGYSGAKETYWLMACSYTNLLKQLDEKGMKVPDWYEKC